MKCFCILFCAMAACVVQGFVVKNPRVERESGLLLPDIKKFTFTVMKPADVRIEWSPVQSPDPADPLLGYKLRVWELPGEITYIYKTIDGVGKFVPEITPAEEPEAIGAPTMEFTTDQTHYQVSNLKLNTHYVFKLAAYTKTMESASFTTTGIKLVGDDSKNL